MVKGLRKGEKGYVLFCTVNAHILSLVILAGDISPVDILSHIPVLCEDTGNPYVFVASKDQLGNASSTKRPTSCVMIVPGGGKKAVEKGETGLSRRLLVSTQGGFPIGSTGAYGLSAMHVVLLYHRKHDGLKKEKKGHGL